LFGAASGAGAIVSIASDLARVGGWGEAVYAGAKAAVVAFSKSLAREVAMQGDTGELRFAGPHGDRVRSACGRTRSALGS